MKDRKLRKQLRELGIITDDGSVPEHVEKMRMFEREIKKLGSELQKVRNLVLTDKKTLTTELRKVKTLLFSVTNKRT